MASAFASRYAASCAHNGAQNMHLYTSRGIGTIVLPLRFGAPPEVALITLRAG